MKYSWEKKRLSVCLCVLWGCNSENSAAWTQQVQFKRRNSRHQDQVSVNCTLLLLDYLPLSKYQARAPSLSALQSAVDSKQKGVNVWFLNDWALMCKKKKKKAPPWLSCLLWSLHPFARTHYNPKKKSPSPTWTPASVKYLAPSPFYFSTWARRPISKCTKWQERLTKPGRPPEEPLGPVQPSSPPNPPLTHPNLPELRRLLLFVQMTESEALTWI